MKLADQLKEERHQLETVCEDSYCLYVQVCRFSLDLDSVSFYVTLDFWEPDNLFISFIQVGAKNMSSVISSIR